MVLLTEYFVSTVLYWVIFRALFIGKYFGLIEE